MNESWNSYAERLIKADSLIMGTNILYTGTLQSICKYGTMLDISHDKLSCLQKITNMFLYNKTSIHNSKQIDDAISLAGENYLQQHIHHHEAEEESFHTIFYTQKDNSDEIISSHRKKQLIIFVSPRITILILGKLGTLHNFQNMADTGIRRELDELTQHLKTEL